MHLDSEGIFEICIWIFETKRGFEIFPSWWFPSTHLKNMLVKLDHFPRDRGNNMNKLKPPPSSNCVLLLQAEECMAPFSNHANDTTLGADGPSMVAIGTTAWKNANLVLLHIFPLLVVIFAAPILHSATQDEIKPQSCPWSGCCSPHHDSRSPSCETTCTEHVTDNVVGCDGVQPERSESTYIAYIPCSIMLAFKQNSLVGWPPSKGFDSHTYGAYNLTIIPFCTNNSTKINLSGAT